MPGAEIDYMAVPIPERPVGLTGEPETQAGPAGQVFRAWQQGEAQYLSVQVGAVETWFVLVSANGRRKPRWN